MARIVQILNNLLASAYSKFASNEPRPSLHPIPGTNPLAVEAALLPPLLYYVALLFLPPAPPPALDAVIIKSLRNILALIAGILFFRLPLAYYVPQSIGLSYQLGLVGIYGGCRVLDAFFISPYLFGHIPRRVGYIHSARPEKPGEEYHYQDRTWTDGGLKDPFSGISNPSAKTSRSATPEADSTSQSSQVNGSTTSHDMAPKVISTSTPIHSGSQPRQRRQSTFQESYYLLSRALSGPAPRPVFEHAKTEDGWPHSFSDRASWALELELSMRGQGFTWTTADVRHTRTTWLPTLQNRMHSVLVHVLPVQLVAWFIISQIYKHYLASTIESPLYNPFPSVGTKTAALNPGYHFHRPTEPFDSLLPIPIQLLLTLSLGSFLMSAFSLGHSLFAIMLHPLSPHPLAFFPPLYTTRVWHLTSVRSFWSYGWHRLFARLFLVWGVWPGEFLERLILRKPQTQSADIGKLLGAFTSSAFVHAFSVRCVLAGRWGDAAGEARFFALNGLACVVEALVIKGVKRLRGVKGGRDGKVRVVGRWYDKWIGRVWWVGVVTWTGREFARRWVKSGLVREMEFR